MNLGFSRLILFSMKRPTYPILLLLAIFLSSCGLTLPVPGGTGGNGGPLPLTDAEILAGLKDAIEVGAKKAAQTANRTDGYFKNPKLFIPFPAEAQNVADKVRQLGLNQLVDDFVMTLNRGAEDAAGKAAPIFADAVKKMGWEDVRGILNGNETAATDYFQKHTRKPLYDAFYPVIKNSLDQVNATKYWTDITGTYNKIPLVKPVNTDLTAYATNKALDGLFVLLAEEEGKIRKDPVNRVTEILKRVFGYTGPI
jgi:hypothetical protein